MGAYVPLDESTIEIKRMRVEPELQRRGFGSAILEELERLALQRGFTRAKLHTTLQQQAAQALYRQSGYEIVGHGREGRFDTVLFENVLRRVA